MKVLFITTNDICDINGGARASQRNLECLQDLYGKENVETCYVKQNIVRKTIVGHFKSLFEKLTTSRVFPSFSDLKILPNSFSLLFIDSSLFGVQIRQLKKVHYQGKVIAFFHNCEADYKALFFKGNMTIGNKLYLRAIRHNERMTIKYADASVFINERDMRRIAELYGIHPRKGEVIAMTMKDAFHDIPMEKKKDDKPIYTILGSYFKPNIEGVKWFAENVYPYVNIRLRIVGKNMHLLRDEIKDADIEIFSNVPDLGLFMAESDYMLYPIFEGSGMKIKTCEALMWGKNIVGTPEAFSGYGMSDYSKIGACCKTAEEFISAINSLNMPRYNKWCRKYYKDNFSYEKSVEQYCKLLNSI